VILRFILGALILGALWLLFFELNRWRDKAYRAVLSRAQKVRRMIGAFLLLCVLGMAFGGTYFPPHPSSLAASSELLYWLFCLLLTVFLPLFAYLEAMASLRKYADQRREARVEATAGMEDLIKKALLTGDPSPKNGKTNKPRASGKPPTS
jgi:magnesium-transporting ATPase (P-type)